MEILALDLDLRQSETNRSPLRRQTNTLPSEDNPNLDSSVKITRCQLRTLHEACRRAHRSRILRSFELRVSFRAAQRAENPLFRRALLTTMGDTFDLGDLK